MLRMLSLITGSDIHHCNPLLACRRAAAESEDVTDAALLVFSIGFEAENRNR
jgi:hypothetical protein